MVAMHFISLAKQLPITLTVGTAERLKALGLLDVMALIVDDDGANQLAVLRMDPARFLKVIWEMIDQSDLTFETFVSLVTAADVEEIWEAFTGEVSGFFPVPIRPTIQRLFSGVEKKLESWLNKIQAAVLSASTSNGSESGEPPESPASIPDHSPTDSFTTWQPADVVMITSGTLP